MEYQATIPLVLGLLSLFLFVISLRRKRPKNYPPGPSPLPIIGNLHNLGANPFKPLKELRKKYGDILAIDFGPFPSIILNEAQLIKKYFNMNEASGRPPLLPLMDRYGDQIPRGIIGTNGEVWKENRRFALRNLRDFGFGKQSIEGLIINEVTYLIKTLEKHIGKSIETTDIFSRAVVNSLYTICTGERACESDKEFESILASISALAKSPPSAGLVWFFPKICKLFPVLSGYQSVMSFSMPMLNALHLKLDQHKATFDPSYRRDLIDCFIDEINNTTNPNSAFFNQAEAECHAMVSIQDLFMAGSETTSTTLCWVFLILALHPEIQDKLHQEVDRVIGNAVPALEQREKMPYYQAFVTEILRFVPVAGLGLMRSATETLEVEGYTIPKGTVLIPNIYGVHHDPEIWGPNADEVKPERFLSADGSLMRSHEAFIPFSTGKRVCLGEGLARDTLFIFTTSIVRKFRVSTDPNKAKPTLDIHAGITLHPKKHELIFYDRVQG